MIVEGRAFTLGRPDAALIPARIGVAAVGFSLGRPAVGLKANYNSDIPDLTQYTNIRLGRLRHSESILEPHRGADKVTGFPATKFQHDYQRNVETTEAAIRALATSQINLQAIVDGLLATQQAVAEVAAQTAAVAAESSSQRALQRVRDSYSDPNPLTSENVGGTANITIAAHLRKYLDPIESVSIAAGSIVGLAPGTAYFVYYDDPDLTGGVVGFAATQSEEEATASLSQPYRHKIGSIATPNTTGGGSEGSPTRPPWQTEPSLVNSA